MCNHNNKRKGIKRKRMKGGSLKDAAPYLIPAFAAAAAALSLKRQGKPIIHTDVATHLRKIGKVRRGGGILDTVKKGASTVLKPVGQAAAAVATALLLKKVATSRVGKKALWAAARQLNPLNDLTNPFTGVSNSLESYSKTPSKLKVGAKLLKTGVNIIAKANQPLVKATKAKVSSAHNPLTVKPININTPKPSKKTKDSVLLNLLDLYDNSSRPFAY
jgi:hypothetical protein